MIGFSSPTAKKRTSSSPTISEKELAGLQKAKEILKPLKKKYKLTADELLDILRKYK